MSAIELLEDANKCWIDGDRAGKLRTFHCKILKVLIVRKNIFFKKKERERIKYQLFRGIEEKLRVADREKMEDSIMFYREVVVWEERSEELYKDSDKL